MLQERSFVFSMGDRGTEALRFLCEDVNTHSQYAKINEIFIFNKYQIIMPYSRTVHNNSKEGELITYPYSFAKPRVCSRSAGRKPETPTVKI